MWPFQKKEALIYGKNFEKLNQFNDIFIQIYFWNFPARYYLTQSLRNLFLVLKKSMSHSPTFSSFLSMWPSFENKRSSKKTVLFSSLICKIIKIVNYFNNVSSKFISFHVVASQYCLRKNILLINLK